METTLAHFHVQQNLCQNLNLAYIFRLPIIMINCSSTERQKKNASYQHRYDIKKKLFLCHFFKTTFATLSRKSTFQNTKNNHFHINTVQFSYITKWIFPRFYCILNIISDAYISAVSYVKLEVTVSVMMRHCTFYDTKKSSR